MRADGDLALEGGPYVHKYRAAQFHFHWGSTSNEGAEHLINGKAYAAEVSVWLVLACQRLQHPSINIYFCTILTEFRSR